MANVAMTVTCSRVVGNISAGWGGGVAVWGGASLITNCSINNNHSADMGGGLWLYSGGYLVDSTIANNIGGTGGGVHGRVGSLIWNCVIASNVSDATESPGGGGVLLWENAKMWNCLIMSNSGNYGAGLNMTTENVVSNCVIRNNYGGVAGGVSQSGGLLINCSIVSNIGNGFFNGSGTNRNCLIAYNTGEGIWQFDGNNALYQNCTIVSNGQKGIYFRESSYTTRVDNCIVYDNVGGNYVNVGGTAVPIWTNSCTTPMPTGPSDTGNITNVPAFVDQAADNWRLSSASFCINRGIYRDWLTNSVDLDGRARIRYGSVDMGAYEHINEGTIFRVW